MSSAIGYRPEPVRQWRAAGHLDGIGRIRDGDMTYDDDDIALIASAMHLVSLGWRIDAAFALIRRYRSEFLGVLEDGSSGVITVVSDDTASSIVINVRTLAERVAALAHEFERKRSL
jgi:hypothetical protein